MAFQEEIKQKVAAREDPFLIQEGKFRDATLEDSVYHLDWAEESFLYGEGDKEMLRRTFDLAKIKYIVAFIGLFLFLLIGRIFWLQIIQGGHYYSLAEGNRLKAERLEPKRGIIYDRNLKPLVGNEANFVLYLLPSDLPKDDKDRDTVLRNIGLLLDNNKIDGPAKPAAKTIGDLQLIPESSTYYDIKNKLDKISLKSLEAYQPLFISDNIDYQTALALYLESQQVPGVFVSDKARRNYLAGLNASSTADEVGISSLAHVMGYIGKINDSEYKKLSATAGDYTLIDYVGKSGLESVYENDLRGTVGKINVEVDALGREKKIVDQTPPIDGHNLVLGIDADLQHQSEVIVSKVLASIGKRRASVVIMDPRNGEIRTLISYPAYDNNLFAAGIKAEDYQKLLDNPDNPLFNRAVSGEFPSGSTIKPVMSAAALQEKIIDENTTVLSTGGLHIGQWSFPDWKAGGHGVTNVKKALAESVNTFFYYVGGGYDKFVGLGIDRIIKYFRIFGLGTKTGIDLPSEGVGFLPTPAWKESTQGTQWYIGDTYHVSIGQGDLTVTPLQVANYTTVFANRGTLYKPHLVTEILDSHNQVLKNISPEIIRTNLVDPQNIEIVREGMRQTITDGSARSLQTVPVPVAGKTGTAQWSTTKANQAWFTGFAPYDNPELVITVLVEEGGEGSSVAVPIAKEILNYYFTRNNANINTTTVNTLK